MKFEDTVRKIADSMPKFNDYLLRGFIRKTINDSPQFPAMVLRESFKVVNDDLELASDPQVMTPEETVMFELTSGANKSGGRPKVPLTTTHMRLVRYQVRFGDQFHYIHLYMPYMYQDMIMIRSKFSMVRKVILEQTFSRISEKSRDRDMMLFSVIRANITFARHKMFRISSYTSGGFYDHFVITSKLFHGNITNKRCETTIVHYMMAKFGFVKTLAKFGISQKDLDFTDRVGDDTDKFEYFAAKQWDDKVEEGPGLFLKVNKILLGEDQIKKFVVNLIYTLSHFKIQTIDNVYVEQGSIWKIMLGNILFNEPAGPNAHNKAESNLRSADTFVDPRTRERLRSFGIMVDDIYDLLVYVFAEIDSFMVNNQPQDLYTTRLDVTNGLLIASYGRRLVVNIYSLVNKSNVSLRDVKSALRISPMTYLNSNSSKSSGDKDYLAPPDIVGDNFLLAGGLNKIRMGGNPEQRFHPSMVVGESISAFGGKTIGRTGYINPYAPIDENGTIYKPDWADAIEAIRPYLPR